MLKILLNFLIKNYTIYIWATIVAYEIYKVYVSYAGRKRL